MTRRLRKATEFFAIKTRQIVHSDGWPVCVRAVTSAAALATAQRKPLSQFAHAVVKQTARKAGKALPKSALLLARLAHVCRSSHSKAYKMHCRAACAPSFPDNGSCRLQSPALSCPRLPRPPPFSITQPTSSRYNPTGLYLSICERRDKGYRQVQQLCAQRVCENC